MVCPFRATVRFLVAQLPPASKITTCAPVAGDAGSVMVNALEEVFAAIWSPLEAV
jgi:hypothetical protein